MNETNGRNHSVEGGNGHRAAFAVGKVLYLSAYSLTDRLTFAEKVYALKLISTIVVLKMFVFD